MEQQLETYDSLDELLDRLVENEDSYSARIRELAARWNADGIALELPLPQDLRRPIEDPRPSGVATIEEQLRAEIDSIVQLDRADEARLSRRIEFARVRLELLCGEHGLTQEELAGSISYDPATYRGTPVDDCSLPPAICDRWVELHALRTELVERNLYLALINVERYAHLGVSRLDLIQEGSAALFRAVDGFDWRRGLLFRTYAVHWLNQAFRSCLYNSGQTVRVPVYLQKAFKHVRAAIERLGDANASAEDIAGESGLGIHLVEGALSARRSTFSMDSPLSNDQEGGGLADLLGDEEGGNLYSTDMEDCSLEDGLDQALDRLSERERYVVEMRFGVNRERPHTLSEVAGELGVSLERVRQIQVRAIKKMRTPTLRKAVGPFL